MRLRPTFKTSALAVIIAGLLLLTLGYWGAWLPHTSIELRILGIDLAEYVKFVPEVTSGQIAIRREVFFTPLLSLALGLILLGTLRRPHLNRWFRALVVALAVPTALAALPPAWTPALLRTPEFRLQVAGIGLLLVAATLSPLLHRYLPDRWRGLLLMVLGALTFLALDAFSRLLPALIKLYGHALAPGTAIYLEALGAGFLIIGGALMMVGNKKD